MALPIMKISSSSSFVVAATLIASSSTPSLAAPAGVPLNDVVTSSGNQFNVASHSTGVVHAAEKDEKEDKKDEKGPLTKLVEGVLCGVLHLGCPKDQADEHSEDAKKKATRDIFLEPIPRDEAVADTSISTSSKRSPLALNAPRSPPTHSHPL
ncbi:hypothetical protein C0991_005067 [Blastosporella zonata]|nr:hypothetical protein C0991_005067 [Blastosporella zonata]